MGGNQVLEGDGWCLGCFLSMASWLEGSEHHSYHILPHYSAASPQAHKTVD